MAKKRVTLFVDSEVYENFKKVCDKNRKSIDYASIIPKI